MSSGLSAKPSSVNLREHLEDRERKTLSRHATCAADSKGRERPEEEHGYRTAFQRDRDRILHTKAFRRLTRKTQVFLAPEGDHYRTRLTHTLEVTQIARTVARALNLNEDLTEAIALGHDLGHTPFGHAGEHVLNRMYKDGFRHYEQSLRVVDKLEETRHGRGLNLTHEVRDGILNHSKGRSILLGRTGQRPSTLEGEVMSVCDAIAYINHDMDDAIRAGIITIDDFPVEAIDLLGRTMSQRINTMVDALIECSQEGAIAMRKDVLDATDALRAFLYRDVYPSPPIDTEIARAKKILRELYEHLVENPIEDVLRLDSSDSLERRTVDFIAGMTDQFALNLYRRLFFPKAMQA